jgi:hypothetical protein
MSKTRCTALLLLATGSLLDFQLGCSGSSSGSVTDNNTYVSGVAYQGSPAIANAAVKLVDSQGRTSSSTTNGSGSFSVATTGLTPPFLVQVATPAGGHLYSVSADANASTTINVTPLTDVIVRGWYLSNSGGTTDTTDTAFGDIAGYPAPPPSAANLLANTITRTANIWLANAGLDAATFNPISTAMSPAEETVLGETAVNLSTGQITFTGTLSGKNMTQTSSLSFPSAASLQGALARRISPDLARPEGTSGSTRVALMVTTTATAGTETSANASSTLVPTPAEGTALAEIQTLLANLAGTVNSKGGSLAYSDLDGFVAPGALNDGQTGTNYLYTLATLLRGATLPAAPQIISVKSLDLTSGTADLVTNLQGTYVPGSGYQLTELQFSNGTGSWLIYGDQYPMQINMSISNRLHLGASYATYGGSGGGTNGTGQLAIGGTIWTTTQGFLSTAQIYTSNGIADADTNTTAWTSAAPCGFSENAGTFTVQLAPTSSTTTNLIYYKWDNGWTDLSSAVPAGTVFTLPLTASGTTTGYTWTSAGYSTENIAIIAPTGTTIPAASLGSPLTVQWTLPATFPIAGVALTAEAYTGLPLSGLYNQSVVFGTTPAAASGFPTSGTITIPATVGGTAVAFVEIEVHIQGVNGELVEPTLNLLVD